MSRNVRFVLLVLLVAVACGLAWYLLFSQSRGPVDDARPALTADVDAPEPPAESLPDPGPAIPNHEPAQQTAEPAEPEDPQATGRVEGSIRFGNRPVSGVQVTARSQADGIAREAISDSDGSYRIDGLPPRQARVTVSYEEGGGSRTLSKPVDITSRKTTRADFDLRAGTAAVTGRVTLEWGTPQGGQVECYVTEVNQTAPNGTNYEEVAQHVVTAPLDGAGTYRITMLPPGLALVSAKLTGADAGRGIADVARIKLEPGITVEQDFHFKRGMVISSLIKGVPDGFEVMVLGLKGHHYIESFNEQVFNELGPDIACQTFADYRGHFDLDGVPPGDATILAIGYPRNARNQQEMWEQARFEFKPFSASGSSQRLRPMTLQ